jgi:hypothetical protein
MFCELLFMKAIPQIKVGCCGFSVAQQNYFQRYHLIEIQYQRLRLSIQRCGSADTKKPDGREINLCALQQQMDDGRFSAVYETDLRPAGGLPAKRYSGC